MCGRLPARPSANRSPAPARKKPLGRVFVMASVSYNPDDDYRPVPGTPEAPANWLQANGGRWHRSDGCCVRIDLSVVCNTSRPWLPNYRGWIAFGNRDDHDYLGYKRKGGRRGFIPVKFKTAQAAMAAVDHVVPKDGSLPTPRMARRLDAR